MAFRAASPYALRKVRDAAVMARVDLHALRLPRVSRGGSMRESCTIREDTPWPHRYLWSCLQHLRAHRPPRPHREGRRVQAGAVDMFTGSTRPTPMPDATPSARCRRWSMTASYSTRPAPSCATSTGLSLDVAQPADVRQLARMDQMMAILDSYAYGAIVGQLAWQRLVVPMTGGSADEASCRRRCHVSGCACRSSSGSRRRPLSRGVHGVAGRSHARAGVLVSRRHAGIARPAGATRRSSRAGGRASARGRR